MPKKKVPATQADELFEFKTMLVKESVKKSIMVHDFTQKIEDADVKAYGIYCPKFEVAGAEFCFFVLPDHRSDLNASAVGYIGVHWGTLGCILTTTARKTRCVPSVSSWPPVWRGA